MHSPTSKLVPHGFLMVSGLATALVLAGSAPVQAQKSGGKSRAAYSYTDLGGFPRTGQTASSEAIDVNEPDHEGVVSVVGRSYRDPASNRRFLPGPGRGS